ncbi:MAG: isoaspartyl peptidase/L-asparaginase [Gammaproteobacteria bacterium]|nr:isoaspartyl peptidase/L-asparaginase [Gammaproteobacteria bacterium]
MSKTNSNWAFALHGGAGAVAGRVYTETEQHLGELASTCRNKLAAGATALDVVEYAVTELEASGLYVAGRGSAPNSAGHVELDASIMDGRSREAGAVAALQDFVNPVGVARGVMEKTPHVMLAGNGAVEFARQHGYEEVTDPATYYTLPVGVTRADIHDIAHGTVGAAALDTTGGLAAATSTGGTFGKLHGRIGDTPLIGPGTWADDNIAISCTGIGEHIIRSGGASSIAFRYKSGVPLETAIQEMLDEIARLGGDAGVIAIARDGSIAMPYNSEGMKRACGKSGSDLFVATFATE